MRVLISEAKTILDETYGEPNHPAPKNPQLNSRNPKLKSKQAQNLDKS